MPSQGIINVLIVPAESLKHLVDSTLRLSHAQALKYIQLREDFKTAHVEGGATLASLFAYD